MAAYHEMNPRSANDPDDELKYKICGQDFVFDLLCIIDILNPIMKMMERAQDLQAPMWKVVGWQKVVVDFMEGMNIETSENMPTLAVHRAEIEKMSFKGV